MGFVRLSALVVMAAVGAWLVTATPVAGQIKVPPDFSFDQGKDSPGEVTFSHEKHKEKVEKCQSCHVKVFKMKKGTTGTLTMAKMKAGEQCGACHAQKPQAGLPMSFASDDKANCERCHKKS